MVVIEVHQRQMQIFYEIFLLYILANVQDAGKYMVRAVNAGGEAQSIADFAVMEPTPERMVEVLKTVVFDNTNEKKVKIEYF